MPKKHTNKPIITTPHPMVLRLDYKLAYSKPTVLFLANDLHLDHPLCNRDLLKQHIEDTIARDGYILFNGDILCVMQGRHDRRGSKGSLRPEQQVDAYFDSVVDEAVDFLRPYADRILYMGTGNHESSVLKRTEIDLLKIISYKLKSETGHNIPVGQYHGFIYVVFKDGTHRSARRLTYKIYHNHGAGGDAPITAGTIEDSRKMMQVEGVDAIWVGHNHNKYSRQFGVTYLDTNPQSMAAKMRIVEVIRSGTYKQEYKGGGFHIEKGGPPKPLGGSWLTLTPVKGERGLTFIKPSIETSWHQPLVL